MIRRARPDDVPAVADLEDANLGPDAWPFGFVVAGVAGEVPTTTWWVAERDGAVVGHAVVSIVADVAELQRISVTPAHRRTGLAAGLLRAVEVQATTEGAERMLLEVRVDNDDARAFYAASGYCGDRAPPPLLRGRRRRRGPRARPLALTTAATPLLLPARWGRDQGR